MSGKTPALEYLFNPASIAVIGVSSGDRQPTGGRRFLDSIVDLGFKGKLYPVNKDGGEARGLKIYTSLQDIPGNIDYVISAIPARFTNQLLLDCAGKGVKAVHLFSAGWAEIADTRGGDMQAEMIALARRLGIRIIGPNCMGIYCPKSGMSYNREYPARSGPFGFISQSGTNATFAIREGELRGLYFSKVISYGNAADLNECDFLEYLAEDPDTEVIGGYIEGIRDGKRFMEVLKEAARRKPVVIYKAGMTEHGKRATASHTSAISGSDTTWTALLKQAGAIKVDSMEELVDILMLFKYMAPPSGKNAALIGVGGGPVVQATDEFTRAGVNLPLLPDDIRNNLENLYTSEAGCSFRNPVDMYWGKGDVIQKAIEIINGSESIDLLFFSISMGVVAKEETTLVEPHLFPYLDGIISLRDKISRNSAVILRPVGHSRYWALALRTQDRLFAGGFPVFPSATRAGRAIIKYHEYFQRRGK